MFCINCGKKISENTKYCPYCEADQPAPVSKNSDPRATASIHPDPVKQTTQPAPELDTQIEKKKSKSRAVVIIWVAVIICTAAVFLLYIGPKYLGIELLPFNLVGDSEEPAASGIDLSAGSSESSEQAHSFEAVYDSARDRTHIIVDGTVLDETVGGNGVFYGFSNNNSVVLLLSKISGYRASLYIVTKNSVKRIVSDASVNVKLSDMGNTVVYYKDDAVYLYDVATDTAKELSSGKPVIEARPFLPCISADGNAVFFMVENEESNKNEWDNYTTYLYSDGDVTKIGSRLIPVSVSNNGEHLYYYEVSEDYENCSLYYMNLNTAEKKKLSYRELTGDSSTSEFFHMVNKDGTQILFYDANGEVWFSEKGGNKRLIEGLSSVSFIMPSERPVEMMNRNYYHTLGIPSLSRYEELLDQLFYVHTADGNRCICYIDMDLRSEIIVSATSAEDILYTHQSVEDNTSVFFCIVDKESILDLYSAQIGSSNRPRQLASDIRGFNVTKNGQTVYYLNNENDLYCLEEDKNPILITRDVYSMSLSHDDILFYSKRYDEETGTGTLYACTNDQNIEKIKESHFYGGGYFLIIYDYFMQYEMPVNTYDTYTSFRVKTLDEEKYDVYVVKNGWAIEKALEGIAQKNTAGEDLLPIPSKSRYIDEVGLLNEQESNELKRRLDKISIANDFDTVIAIVESLGEWEARRYAAEIYEEYDFGIDEQNSGVILLIATESRDWGFATTGRGIEVFPQSSQDSLFDGVLPFLSEDDYFNAFLAFADKIEKSLLDSSE